LDPAVTSSLQTLLGITIVLYLLAMYAIACFAQRKIHSVEDFVVAGRHLPLSLSWLTILATWFGAGTLLAVADEVRAEGIRAAALDPIGAGSCLIFVGLFLAAPMWRFKLLTVPDFFGRMFGPTAELLSAAILVPSYFGWIAAQFVALAGMLELFFGLDPAVGITAVAVVGTGYTLMGGMWSVTLTDAVQMILVMVGLVLLTCTVVTQLGNGSFLQGWIELQTQTPPEKLTIMPTDSLAAMLGWLGLFITGSLGNVPVQDLMQRVFSAKSDVVAKRACLIAGAAYLSFGALPIVLALSADLLLPQTADDAIIPTLAHLFLSPAMAVIFVLALLSAILSTIDSAILSPASVLSHNVFSRWSKMEPMKLTRYAVVLVSGLSVLVAYSGENAYTLLEEAYALTLVGLFVPMMFGLYSTPLSPRAAIASMLAGTVSWLTHFLLGWEYFLSAVPAIGVWQVPDALGSLLIALLSYLVAAPIWQIRWQRP
jgi:SSS family solute:Na+ symporter